MGCDIHLHSEVKINGVWHHHSAPDHISRIYELFAKMAGVRSEDACDVGVPISLPKGLPSDVTLITRIDHEREDSIGHSHSWFNIEEICELEEFIESSEWFHELFFHEEFPDFMDMGFPTFKKYPEKWEEYKVEDVRWVFWFDN